MRRTRLRRKIDLDNDVSASSPSMLTICNIDTPRGMRRRSMGTPGLASIPNTPICVDSPNRTLNETFSPEPEEKVFSIRTLIDSVKKHKRHTSSTLMDTNQLDTPRVTRATLNSAKKSRTSIKKASKESPVFANLKKIVSTTLNTTFLETVGQVADVVAGETKVIKSIRKQRRSSSVNTILASEKKNVKFHSPANMEVSTFDIDVKMQSDRKVLRSMRSLSNAETDKAKNKIILTPEKVEKKTPGSRKKMPNFSEIHQRQFERMESITEHAARRAERAKILSRSPKMNIKTETVNIHEAETVVIPKEEPEIVPEIVEELKPQVRQESEVVVKQETEFVTAQELKPDVVHEPESIIKQVPVSEVVPEPSLIIEQEPMLDNEQEPLEMDELNLRSGTSSISTSPFIIQGQIPISKLDLTPLTESEERRASALIGRSPFAIQIQESISLPPKSPAINKRPIAISRIPGKIRVGDKKQIIPSIRPKSTKQDLNATTITKIPQPKFNSSVLIPSSKSYAPSNLNTSNVFVFKANKSAPLKPVASAPLLSQNKTNLKRTASMVAIKPRPAPIPVRPAAKENHIDKVKERQQKNMSLYKSRPDPDVKPRTTAAPKNVIAVRTNKRFELQMKFRQMNGNN